MDLQKKPRHPWLWRLVELGGLHALAVARPVLELAVATPEFFTVRDAPGTAIVAFGIVLLAIPPLMLLGVEALAERARHGLGGRVHAVLLGVLLAILAVPFLVRLAARFADVSGIGLSGWLLLAIAAMLSVAAVAIVQRWPPARSFLRALGFAPTIVLGIFLGGAPLGGASSPPTLPLERPAPLVMVIFDEFPAASLYDPDGTVSRSRMPTFARLAQEASWWPDATGPGDTTPHVVPSLLSGVAPRVGKAPSVETYPRNLFTLLGRRYDVTAFEPVTALCPRATCRTDDADEAFTMLLGDAARLAGRAIAPPDLRNHLPPVIGEQGTLTDPDAQVEAFIDRLHPTERPTLRLLHVMLPHHPWSRLASGQRYTTSGDRADRLPEGFENPLWTRDAAVVTRNQRRHLAQAAYADRVLGRVVQHLKDTGQYDRTLLVATADHGISFRPGGPARFATLANLGEIVAVPLFMKRPGQRRGGPLPGRAELVDVLPTIMDVLGAPPAARRGSLLGERDSYGMIVVSSSYGRDLRARLSDVVRQRELAVRSQPPPWTAADLGR